MTEGAFELLPEWHCDICRGPCRDRFYWSVVADLSKETAKVIDRLIEETDE